MLLPSLRCFRVRYADFTVRITTTPRLSLLRLFRRHTAAVAMMLDALRYFAPCR